VSVVSRAAGVPCEEALFGGLLADLPLIGVEALLAAEVQVAREGEECAADEPEFAAAVVASQGHIHTSKSRRDR
jgi:hypothetical protein